MAKITARADLNVGTEIIINEAARTIQTLEAGNLVAKDGVSLQATYSKLVDLWAIQTYQDSPFPMNAIDAESGQYQIGIDPGGEPNGWAWADDATRKMQRDGGFEEYDAAGTLQSVYCGVVGLGAVSTGSQLYYQLSPGSAPIDFTFDDQANEAVKVFENGSFDSRTFLKGFIREQGFIYRDSSLADTAKSNTGPILRNLLLSNEADLKITDLDAEMTNAPYSSIDVTYFASPQTRTIGGVAYNYSVIVDGGGSATLEQIYTKCQYLLRQNSDIDSGAGTVIGKTADLLCAFVGSTLETTTGVFVDNILPEDSNRIRFQDNGGTFRENPFESAGVITFNPIMVQAGSSYRLMYSTPPGAGDDYGESGAITVNDASGNPIAGVITSGSISFTFDYDNDAVGGTAGTDKPYTLIGIAPGFSKFAVSTGTLTKSKAVSAGLVAEVDRAYL
jgi:hypothetical protein